MECRPRWRERIWGGDPMWQNLLSSYGCGIGSGGWGYGTQKYDGSTLMKGQNPWKIQWSTATALYSEYSTLNQEMPASTRHRKHHITIASIWVQCKPPLCLENKNGCSNNQKRTSHLFRLSNKNFKKNYGRCAWSKKKAQNILNVLQIKHKRMCE